MKLLLNCHTPALCTLHSYFLLVHLILVLRQELRDVLRLKPTKVMFVLRWQHDTLEICSSFCANHKRSRIVRTYIWGSEARTEIHMIAKRYVVLPTYVVHFAQRCCVTP